MAKALKIVGIVVGAVALVATGIGLAVGAGTFLGIAGSTFATIGAIAGVVSGVIGLAQTFLAPKPGFSSAGNPLQFQTNPQSGLPYPIGRTRMSGVRIHADTYAGPSSEGKQDTLAFAVLLGAGGPHDAIETFRADKVATTFGAGGAATSAYAGWMAQVSSLGIAGAAALSLTFNGGGFPGWTGQHKLSGMAHALWDLKFDKKGETFASGVPEPEWIGRWAKVYDPRKDSTYPGGSGAHRWGDESTYEWTRNPAIHALNWCLGRWQNGKKVIGIGAPMANIRVADFVNAANIADTNNWWCGGVEWSTDAPWTTLKRMLQACGAEPSMQGAMIGCTINAPKVSIATVTQDDLLDELTITASKSRRDRFNTVIPRYRSEANDWQVISGTPVSVPAYVTADGGQRTKEIDYALVQHELGFTGVVEGNVQAGQLAAYDIVNSREATIRFTTKPKFFAVRTGDCITLNAPDEGISNQLLIVKSIERDPATMQIRFECETETSSKHAFALGQSTTPPPAWSPTAPDLTPTQPSDSLWAVTGGALTSGAPAIRVVGAAEFPGADFVLLQYKKTTDTDWKTAGEVTAREPTDAIISGIDGGADYDVRIAYLAGTRLGPWRQKAAVTVPAAVLNGQATSIVGQGALATLSTISYTTHIAGDKPVVWAGRVIDTRNSDYTPTQYRTDNGLFGTSGGTGTILEFKTASTVKSGETGFGFTETVSKWQDDTGGGVEQTLYLEDGRIFTRVGTSAGGWGAWQINYNAVYKPIFGADLREDVSTIATLANFKTNQGTAAAITGQGTLATKSSVAWWSDITNTPVTALYQNLVSLAAYKPGALDATNTADPNPTGAYNRLQGSGTAGSNKLVGTTAGPSGEAETLLRGDGLGTLMDGGLYHYFGATEGYDHTRPYRFMVWVQRPIGAGDFGHYFGCGPCKNLDGSVNNNPYFLNAFTGLTAGKWYLLVGILHGSGYTGSDSGISGLYDPVTGKRVVAGVDFKADAAQATQYLRYFLYTTTVGSTLVRWARPSVQEISAAGESFLASIGTPGATAGTNIFRTDGSTVLNQDEIRTPEGTAAAIANQGALATLSTIDYVTHITNDVNRPEPGAGVTDNLLNRAYDFGSPFWTFSNATVFAGAAGDPGYVARTTQGQNGQMLHQAVLRSTQGSKKVYTSWLGRGLQGSNSAQIYVYTYNAAGQFLGQYVGAGRTLTNGVWGLYKDTLTLHNDTAYITAYIQTLAGDGVAIAEIAVPRIGITELQATLGAQAGTSVFRTDGVTILTQAEIRTAEGTAAAITNQGTLATSNTADFSTQVGGAAKPADNAGRVMNLAGLGANLVVRGNTISTATEGFSQANRLRSVGFKNSISASYQIASGQDGAISLHTSSAYVDNTNAAAYAHWLLGSGGGGWVLYTGGTLRASGTAASAGAMELFYDGINYGLKIGATIVATYPAASAGLTHFPSWWAMTANTDYNILLAGYYGDIATYRDDGTTRLTQIEIRTIEGTSNAITGQGALATMNTVPTANLGTNAATAPWLASSNSVVNFASGTKTQLLSLSVSKAEGSGSLLEILAQCEMYGTDAVEIYMMLELYDSSAVLVGSAFYTVKVDANGTTNLPFTYEMFADGLAAGTYTAYLYGQRFSSNTCNTNGTYHMRVREYKR